MLTDLLHAGRGGNTSVPEIYVVLLLRYILITANVLHVLLVIEVFDFFSVSYLLILFFAHYCQYFPRRYQVTKYMKSF